MEELRHKICVKSFRLTSQIPWRVGDNLCRFKIHDFRLSVRADNQRAGIKDNKVAYLSRLCMHAGISVNILTVETIKV